ncbi:MAG: hypothetical protein HWD84_08305 [Flavobacteriaceae bacterium]|nr:hypothetical protein [Flavobacteriaceae bacterium]
MQKTKKKAVLFVYGEGGHRAEMVNLLKYNIVPEDLNVSKIGIFENGDKVDFLDENFELPIINDKYSRLRTLFGILACIIKNFKVFRRIKKTYQVSILVTIGPGIAIIPAIYYRLKGTKIVFIETSSRFYSKSYTGRVLEKLAAKVYVQNEELMSIYKNSEYCGKLL